MSQFILFLILSSLVTAVTATAATASATTSFSTSSSSSATAAAGFSSSAASTTTNSQQPGPQQQNNAAATITLPPTLIPTQTNGASIATTWEQNKGQFPSQLEPQGDIKNQFLHLHNKARKHAYLPPLVWDVKLEEYARNYLNQRIIDCNLIHSNGPYGENLFWGGGGKWTPKDAVRMWVKEHKYYDKRTNSCKNGKLCGHYTQVVWRDSTRVGCAIDKCKNGDTFSVCSYDPPGNYVGEVPFLHYEH